MNSNSGLVLIGFLTIFFFTLTAAVIGMASGFEVGCHVVGTEINGDYSTEYLMMGNC